MRGTVQAVAAAAVFLASSSAAWGAGWLPAQQLSPTETSLVSTSTAFAPDAKDAIVGWRDGSGGAAIGLRPAGGVFATTALTAPVTSGPSVATAADGHAAAVWVSGGIVQFAERPAGGAFGAATPMSEANTTDPVVVITPQGTTIVAWERAGWGIEYRARPPGGAFTTTAPLYVPQLGETLPGALIAAVGPAGDVVLAHVGARPNGTTADTRTLRANFRPAGGSFEIPAKTIHTLTVTDVGDTTRSVEFDGAGLAVDGAGNTVVTFRERTTSDYQPGGGQGTHEVRTRVMTSRRTAAAGTWSTPVDLEPPHDSDNGVGSSASVPALALDEGGAPTAVWGVKQSTLDPVLRAASAGDATSAFGTAATIGASPAPSDGFAYPALIGSPGGGLALAVFDNSSVRVRVRPPGSPTFGDPITVSASAEQIAGPIALASDGDGDLVVTWSVYSSPSARMWMAIHDASAPQITSLDVPATAPPGTPVPMGVTTFDAFSAVTVGWTFGDDGVQSGTTVSHAYALLGPYAVKITATDAAGNTAVATRPIDIAPPPPPPAPTPAPTPTPGAATPGATLPAPVLRSFRITPSRFAVGSRSTALSAATRRGASLRFDVSAAATVRATFARLLSGRRSGTRCVKPTRKLRSRKRCTRAITRGSLTRKVTAGPRRIAFSGRLGRKALAPGRYRATIVATAPGAPRRSAARTATFTIVRR